MAYLSSKPERLGSLKNLPLRHAQGSVTPFLAMSVIFMLGTVGLCLDLMRDFETYGQLDVAAESAALYGLSLATDSSGNYSKATAQSNITSAILNVNASSWNKADLGPTNGSWSSPVTFADNEILFVNNPLDANEFFLQLNAERNGQNSIKHFFLPILYTVLAGNGVPAAIKTFNTHRIIEVLGQPATRMGAGPPLSSTIAGSRDADFIGSAASPLAISNQQFAPISNPSLTTTAYTIDLVSSTGAKSVQAGHIKGCFVNVSSGAGNNNFYGSGQGDLAIDQLKSLFNYCSNITQQSLPPAVVENGSQLSAFDPADPIFTVRRAEILQSFSQLLPPASARGFFVVPVLAQDPSFTASNTVIGFARLKFNQLNVDNSGNISLTITLGESVPVRNASSSTGFSNVFINGNQSQMPPVVSPFTPRSFDANSNGVTARPRGVVLAPSLSPRQIFGS